MANPQRVPDPRYSDPLNPTPTTTVDPVAGRYDAANASVPPTLDDRVIVQNRSGGTGVLIAAVVIVLALAAYFMFAPSTETVAPVDQPVTSEPAAPAPDAAVPAAPDAAAPAPAPTGAAPAPVPAEPAPSEAAPAPAEPAAPAPAAPAPAEAPAQ